MNVSLTQPVSDRGLTYKDSGVDIAAGNTLVDMIKPLAKATSRAGNLKSETLGVRVKRRPDKHGECVCPVLRL